MVLNEMYKRGYKVKLKKFNIYFNTNYQDENDIYYLGNIFVVYHKHHNFQYLRQCYYNLEEKFMRGQKDFDIYRFSKLFDFYSKELEYYNYINNNEKDIKEIFKNKN